MAKVIYDSGLKDFLDDIAKEMVLYAPIYFNRTHHEQIAFRRWHSKAKLAPKYPVTILPPTEFLLPSEETLLTFQGETVLPVSPEPQIIFGLSLEDLSGLQRLDKIMSTPVKDEIYAHRREKTFIIGLDKFSPPAGLDYDVYLQEFEPGVFGATAKSRQGKKWLNSKHFRNQTVAISRIDKKEDPLLSDPLLGRAIKESAQHPIWSELSEICFGCGICSFVCPLCYCYDTQDKTDLGDQGCGERCRQWDSCLHKNFTATTKHNSRSELKDRIYNWYYHKFYRLPREHNFNGCVDCSRCAVYCPAKINFRRVLSQVLTDYKKRPKK